MLHHQCVRVLVVLHYLVVLHVVVRDRLPSEHYQRVFIHHVQAHQPNPAVHDRVQHQPRVSLDVQLLDRGSVPPGLVAHRVNVSVSKSAAVRPAHSLLKARQGSLRHRRDLELLALTQILALERAANDVDELFKLGDAEINSVVHHFPQSPEGLRGDVEEQDLRAGNVGRPVKLISFVAAHNEDVLFINHHYFPLAYLPIEDLEAGPFQALEVVESVLI